MSEQLSMPQSPDQGQDPLGMNSLSGFMFNPVNSTIALMALVRMLLFNILRASCVPAELIFRNKFGERYFNLWLYISGTTWLYIFAAGVIDIPGALGFNPSVTVPNAVIFLGVGVIFFASFLREFFIRKFREINSELHSRYDGDPMSFLFKLPFAKDSNGNPKEYFVRQFYEPLFMLLLGVIVSGLLNPQTGSWLIISAIGMAVKENVKAQYTRNTLLDHIDAEITAQNIKAALAGEPPAKTKGIYIAGLPAKGQKKEQLKDILDKKQESFKAADL